MDYSDIVEIRCREEVDEEFAALDVLGTNNYHPTEDYYECDPCYNDQSYEDDYSDMEGGFGSFDMDYGDIDCGW